MKLVVKRERERDERREKNREEKLENEHSFSYCFFSMGCKFFFRW